MNKELEKDIADHCEMFNSGFLGLGEDGDLQFLYKGSSYTLPADELPELVEDEMSKYDFKMYLDGEL